MLVVSAARFDSDDEVTILRISNVHFEDWARLEMHLQNTPYERWSQQNTSVTKLKQQHVAAKLRNAASDVATMSSVVAQMKHHDAGSTSDTASQTTLPTNTLTSASSTGSGTKGKDKA
ncbi:hypothetical protein SARC_13030 [Sphaeroforma arctica JP610]|uniref:Uncharacterized protein n=1 Tax=Sphaeroforma arctica JP610 TaxID=667725 RepID=A0A0L0FCC1_9EUKA|nr:hypothetical protein SARC_13030 [Sphaeroforma arctica JP610]KNC74422.1 hypothetical protein SARC_13030 [Sphaeroforma arctica JP610]|eukprot:XP_014148324.1 hypothetical protein SARC_13030 [Sphaeroforma arctica JP610]